MTSAAVALVTACVVAVVLTPLFRGLAHRVGYLDVPGAQSSHDLPVPRSGGYAILVAILAAITLQGGFGERDIAIAIAGAVVLAVVAAVDDIRPLPRFSRLVVQAIVATAIAYEGSALLQEVSLPFGVVLRTGALSGVLALVWIVGMINAYNFMDGLNGIAAAEGSVSGIALGLLSLSVGDGAGAAAAFAIAGACAGFLPWNCPSGSIFMGDVGSATLGFLFAVLTLRLSNHGVPLVVAALPLLPFLFDSSVTVLLRASRGERFFATRHRSHFYQRLNQSGYSHAQVTMVYALLATTGAVVALIYGALSESAKVLMLAGVLAMHLALASWVTSRESR
jgi:UDP-N-acetylmuramyl pentapeptide phosphotransferase/UDP-N-acetylglucosamine-1-phosphate transferase